MFSLVEYNSICSPSSNSKAITNVLVYAVGLFEQFIFRRQQKQGSDDEMLLKIT